MRKGLLWTLVLLGFGMGPQESRVSVHYSSPRVTWDWDGGDATGRRWIQEFENPVSAVPSRQTSEALTKVLSPIQKSSLETALRHWSTEFFSLDEDQGAPEIQRHYPYEIILRVDGRQHRMVFRSNPSFPGAPRAFLEIEKLLLQTFGP